MVRGRMGGRIIFERSRKIQRTHRSDCETLSIVIIHPSVLLCNQQFSHSQPLQFRGKLVEISVCVSAGGVDEFMR